MGMISQITEQLTKLTIKGDLDQLKDKALEMMKYIMLFMSGIAVSACGVAVVWYSLGMMFSDGDADAIARLHESRNTALKCLFGIGGAPSFCATLFSLVE